MPLDIISRMVKPIQSLPTKEAIPSDIPKTQIKAKTMGSSDGVPAEETFHTVSTKVTDSTLSPLDSPPIPEKTPSMGVPASQRKEMPPKVAKHWEIIAT